jgi:hypothetical protein
VGSLVFKQMYFIACDGMIDYSRVEGQLMMSEILQGPCC